MKGGTCKTCLWWLDLYDTDERKCYKRESRYFHERTAADHRCDVHETLARKDIRLGTYKGNKGGK